MAWPDGELRKSSTGTASYVTIRYILFGRAPQKMAVLVCKQRLFTSGPDNPRHGVCTFSNGSCIPIAITC
jgi:hypothetical protein